MFNPHIHQQQQQQQLHQHLRQLQQLFQQQPPPPPPAQPPPAHHVGHHHQTPRAIPVPTQAAPPPRMVNLCQTTQTTLIAPNPMLQSAILMQQMQGNMRGFGMGGQQFRQFFTAGARSSLLGPVPMGMAIKSPIMGFPAARAFHPHSRFFNAGTASSSSSISATDAAARQPDRKRDSEQMAAGSPDNQPAAANSTDEMADETQTDGAVEERNSLISEEQLEEPVTKRQKTDRSEEPKEQTVVERTAQSESANAGDIQSEGGTSQTDEGLTGQADDLPMEETNADDAFQGLSAQSPSGGLGEDKEQINVPAEETTQDKDTSVPFPENQDEEEASEGSNKFYCYLCSITCHNQQNFRSHMNSISHQQRMMEIQHMSNACLVTLLPRVQESLQGASKDGEKKADLKQWCATCHTHFTCSTVDHQRSEEHKLASKTDLSFCAVCQKRFKTSLSFLEHLHSQEHRQKIQEKGCETLSKLTNIGTDGFSIDLEAHQLQKNDGEQETTKDGWSSAKEVALDDLTSEQQYDPDIIYGSSFLDPVAGFICRLCNKFYLFESSALHSHCKSLQHFENLKSYKVMVAEKDEAAHPSRKSPPSADSLRHDLEISDCSKQNVLSTDTGEAIDLNSNSATKPEAQEENELMEKQVEASSTSQDLSISAASSENLTQELSSENLTQELSSENLTQELSSENLTQELSSDQEERCSPSQVSGPEESSVEIPAVSREQAGSEPAAVGLYAEEEEPPVALGKKNCGGKAKNTAKRRSGRAANRR